MLQLTSKMGQDFYGIDGMNFSIKSTFRGLGKGRTKGDRKIYADSPKTLLLNLGIMDLVNRSCATSMEDEEDEPTRLE